MTGGFLELHGVRIKEDADGNICLTDLWRLAGEPGSKTTTSWRRLPTTCELVEALFQNLRKSQVMNLTSIESICYSKAGKGGGSYAHPILALAYAEYLEASLAVEVKHTYLRFRQGDITLVDEVLAKADEARKWQGTRDASKLARERFTGVLQEHGCAGSDIGYVTNAIYVVLLGGKAPDVKESRCLPAKANLRDNLPLKELVQTMATEVMASERIEDEDRQVRLECYDATARSAGFIRDAFERERADRKPR